MSLRYNSSHSNVLSFRKLKSDVTSDEFLIKLFLVLSFACPFLKLVDF